MKINIERIEKKTATKGRIVVRGRDADGNRVEVSFDKDDAFNLARFVMYDEQRLPVLPS